MKTKLPLLLLLVLIGSIQISAQDVIFKKNGEIIKTTMLNQTGSSISYRHYDNRDSLTHFISASIIDSIIYQNGTKEFFKKSTIKDFPPPQTLKPVYLHHLIGVDMTDLLLYNSYGVSYEYLPGKMHIGFKAAFEKGIPNQYESDISNVGFNNWNVRLGVDYYIFPPRTFRFVTGLHYVYTQYKNYSNYSSDGFGTKENSHNIMFALFGFYNITKHLAFNLGFYTPVLNGTSSYSTIYGLKGEVMYNF